MDTTDIGNQHIAAIAAQTAEHRNQNAAMIAELGGDAREVAEAFILRFPDAKITSAARDYKDQAAIMARNTCGHRAAPGGDLNWIANTYWPGHAARTLQSWFVTHSNATVDECTTAFISMMRAMTAADLRALSKHIVCREIEQVCFDDKAHAFDVEPVIGVRGDVLSAYLRSEAQKRGGRFLAVEGGEIRWHWQAR